MKVLVVSGIWPPDVGGPASHGPDVGAFLTERGHDVTAVVAASAPPGPQPFRVEWVSRSLPKGVVHVAAAARIAQLARTADVVYATGMFGRTAAAATSVRTPYVVKLTGDPAFERARWRDRVGGDVVAFQEGGGGVEGTVLRRFRDLTLRGAAHIVCPSAFLRGLALGWGVAAERITVLPNPAPEERPAANRSHDGIRLAFAGRLGPQKSLETALQAVERVEGVSLVVAGDGDARAALESAAGPHTQFVGPLARADVLELFASADASVLPSSWENFPHTVVESLAVGTPVIATAVGGVPEVVQDGVNGLLVPPGDVDAFTAAVRRFVEDGDLRAQLQAAAEPSVDRYSRESVYGRLEGILEDAAR
jgi:glycosyltransferase involved in cell wall biosynthesis